MPGKKKAPVKSKSPLGSIKEALFGASRKKATKVTPHTRGKIHAKAAPKHVEPAPHKAPPKDQAKTHAKGQTKGHEGAHAVKAAAPEHKAPPHKATPAKKEAAKTAAHGQPETRKKKSSAPQVRTSLSHSTHDDSVCREVACENLATTGTYCRLHYIKNWKKIKRKELILKEGKLNRYIEELVAMYPDKYIEAIRQDLAHDKDFAKVITDLDLDE